VNELTDMFTVSFNISRGATSFHSPIIPASSLKMPTADEMGHEMNIFRIVVQETTVGLPFCRHPEWWFRKRMVFLQNGIL